MKIYCDTGGYQKAFKTLQRNGLVELCTFQYENKNKHIADSGIPSNATYADLKNYSYSDLSEISYSDFSGSDKYTQILSILGLENRVDILHLDSAYKSQCEIFVTSDKHDILLKREELSKLLGMRIFQITELQDCIDYIETNHTP